MTLLQELTREIRNLTPIPAVVNQLLSVVDKPGSGIEEIADVIKYDPVITVNVLKTCNSAFFGLKNPAESIKDAVNMLGVDQVVELVLMKSSSQTLSGEQKGYGLEDGDLWRYSVSSAVISKIVAGKLSLENRSTLFTAALVKDIGKILMEKYVQRSSKKIHALVDEKHFSFREAEKKTVGIDHAEVGAMITKMWKFSPRMVKIIRHHHLSDDSMIRDRDITAVYLSDCICMMLGIGVGADGLSYRFKDRAMKELGITADDISEIIAEFGFNMQEIEEFLKIA